jgi:hypothetical protein
MMQIPDEVQYKSYFCILIKGWVPRVFINDLCGKASFCLGD